MRISQQIVKGKKRREFIEKWINGVLEAGVATLIQEFKMTPFEVPLDECTYFLKNPDKNRYPNVGCLDRTRFVLQGDDNFYIHANYVKICDRKNRFLCTQGPLPSTVNDFWRMTVSAGAEFIVMLCALIENGVSKCYKYYPDPGEEVETENFKISNEGAVELPTLSVQSKDRVIQQKFKIFVKNENRAVRVSHVQWSNWPDHGLPDSCETPLRILSLIRKSMQPIIVHCSAGVGRTGTLVFVESLIMALRYPKKQNPKNAFVQLRKDRAKCIQTLHQFVYAHRCVLEYCFSKKHKKNEEKWEKFKEDYAQFMSKKKKNDNKGKKKKCSASLSADEIIDPNTALTTTTTTTTTTVANSTTPSPSPSVKVNVDETAEIANPSKGLLVKDEAEQTPDNSASSNTPLKAPQQPTDSPFPDGDKEINDDEEPCSNLDPN
ncbi:unnamed protein product [Caenorhabditis bovis]|uniref:Protein-tyrosine-phosphatase n=1 Tax=Caenorhabditis bovis TaxID=2654633 RepID=A0A8S1F3H9_9PELO|nr:unnamed protein product [Caenorhabditis bovis]